MRYALFLVVGVLFALQMSACNCTLCLKVVGGSPLELHPTPLQQEAVASPAVAAAVDAAMTYSFQQPGQTAQWSLGPEVAALTGNGSTDLGFGGQAVCEITGQPLGLTGGTTLYFPDAGSAYGAWGGYRYNLDGGDGPVDFFGVGAAVWSHYGYDTDEYEIPEGLGGGAAAFQQGFGGGGDAFGVRLGAGAQLADDDRRIVPYGEVGYDLFLLGDDFDNQVRFGAGLSIKVGDPIGR